MRNFLAIVFLAGFVLSCAPDTPTSTSSSLAPPTIVDGDKPATTPAASGKKTPRHVEPSFLSPILGTWEVQHTLKFKDPKERVAYMNSFFTLRGDQTFDYGQYGEIVTSGTYDWENEEKMITFHFEKAPPYIAPQYKLNGVGFLGTETTIWLGNTPLNPAGMQLKMGKMMPES